MQIRRKSLKAFSLLELSIVIVIVSILLTGALSASIVATNNAKIKFTKNRMQEIYRAMGAFLATNSRLPCPASMLLTKTNVNYGVEVSCASTIPDTGVGIWQSAFFSNVIYGAIPTKALGLSSDMAEDAFGSKFGYVVIRGFTSSTNFGTDDATTYTNGSSARITIHDKYGSMVRQVNPGASNGSAIFVIISYGPNKNGAFNANSVQQNNTVDDHSDEGQNVLHPERMSSIINGSGFFYNYGVDGAFTNYPLIESSDNDAFDDILFYKTRGQLLVDFDLLSKMGCNTTSSSITYDTTAISWAAGAKYNENAIASADCPVNCRRSVLRATRRCGPLGSWKAVMNPCLCNYATSN